MDSVSDKPSYLSMTGIDQTEENTESINVLNAQIADFVKNVIPYIIRSSPTDQFIDGNKVFYQPIGTCGFEPLVLMGNQQPITFNKKGRYKLVFDPDRGFNIDCPLTLLNNAISIANVSGLQDALSDAKNSPNTAPLPDRSVSTTQIAFSTILGNNLAVDIAINTSGDITCKNTAKTARIRTDGVTSTYADITTLIAGSSTANKFSVLDQNSSINPLLNVSIPFCPVTNSKLLQTKIAISFFSSPAAVLPATNRMLRYRHPFNYYIHGISIMYAAETTVYSNTTTIIIYTYDSANAATLLGTASIPTNAGKIGDYFTLPTPLFVTSNMTLGGNISTPANSKQGTYVIMGYQG
jgi:hypothetical protein